MTESDGTTVSHQYFTGFGNKDVYEAFTRCQAIKLFLSDVFNVECDPKNFGLNEKTLNLKMTEDFNGAELEKEVTLTCETHPSSVLSRDLSTNDCWNKASEFLPTPLKFEKGDCEEFLKTESDISKCETASSSEDRFASELLSDFQIISTINHETASELDSALVTRAPSPLLFTPVKGENTYGAGYLTQNTESQPSSSFSNNHAGSISKNGLPPVFATPPPKSAKKLVLSLTPSGCLYSERDVKINLQCENRINANGREIPSRSVPEEVKIQRDNIYPCRSSPTSNLEEGNHSSPKISTNTEGANLLPKHSPHVEKLSHDFTPSCDPLPSQHCMLEPQLNSSPPSCMIGNDETVLRPIISSPSNSSLNNNSKKVGGMITLVRPDPPKPARVNLRTRRKHRLRTLLSRARHSLAGLPPPPSITIPQLTVTEILEKIQKSGFSVSAPNSTTEFLGETTTSGSDDSASLFHPSATEQEIMEMSWPAVLDCVHLGVCYNLGCSSEALEDLCQQVREKYVGNETASSCNVWSLPRSLEESNLKRRNGASQACSVAKEGYITRRRRAFSLASLATTIPSIAAKSRQILVNGVMKKPEAVKMPAKHKREYDGSRVTKKEDNKRSLTKRCFGDKGKNTNKLNSIKRSLSFDVGSSNQAQSSSTSVPDSSSSSQHAVSHLISTKRVLKFDTITKASTEVCSTQKEVIRCKSSPSLPGNSEAVLTHDSLDHKKNQSLCATGSLVKELSEVHKKKLLWAVAQALRSRGLGTGHDKFKICAIPLFRHCRDEFLNTTDSGNGVCFKSCSSDDSLCDPVGVADSHKESTSDKMLNIALGLVDKIMNEIGVEPVVKERTAFT